MANEPRLHRVILHLRHGAAERAIIRAAAELAQMLGVALHGVFLEDEALPELAALPFIREFRLGTGAWHKLDRQQIAAEQHAAATEARRLLDEAAAAQAAENNESDQGRGRKKKRRLQALPSST